MITAVRAKLTFSNVLALVAVFLALGGTVYAAAKINGKLIKKGSEPGNRLKHDSVTGKQVNEATLKINGKVIKNGSEPGNRLKDDSVTGKQVNEATLKLPKVGVTFPIHKVTTLNLDPVAGSSCAGVDIPAPGIRSTDHVLITPPGDSWPDTFTATGRPEASTNSARLSICNTFTGGGSADPDGTGGPYKVLVIR